MNYLKAAMLDGEISKQVYEKVLTLDFPSAQKLLGLIPDPTHKRVRSIFFRNKYTKPCTMEYRKLDDSDKIALMEKLDAFFQAFNIPEQQRKLLLSSDYSIIRTVEEERETPIPPQEVPVEE
ncbi:MAG: hypothetical protein ABSE82_03465 [Nitrososphaerales archaeon]